MGSAESNFRSPMLSVVSALLAAAAGAASAETQTGDAATALPVDDECHSASSGDGNCVLSALQRKASQKLAEGAENRSQDSFREVHNLLLSVFENDSNTTDASMGSSGIWHYALNCWDACGQSPGFCPSYCGPGNACCRHGAHSDPEECSRTKWWPVYTFHTCVQVREAATTSTPPSPVAAPCEDRSQYCGAWSKSGQCTTNPKYMLVMCKKSCDQCATTTTTTTATTTTTTTASTTTSVECTDGSQYCEVWANGGQCTANPGYMLKMCKKSCAQCQASQATSEPQATPAPVCEDTSSGCTYWAALGLCGGCQKTCGKCSTKSEPTATNTAGASKFARIESPPKEALGYSGTAWPEMTFPGTGEMHILAIGDWGGMDGTVVVDGKRPKKDYYRIIQYKGGDADGPHTMARSRIGCEFANLVECFNTQGETGGKAESPCLPACGWTAGIDDRAQLLVAEQFKKRAAVSKPQYVLNVGDNFYWGGIETDCGAVPMGEISKVAKHQFDSIYEHIYNGPGLDGVPWLSVLGNHDWGGRYFNSGWDQQISYTWHSNRWIMPAPYWSQRMTYPDQGFSVDILMTDSNAFDAKNPEEDPEHNICGRLHTPEQANCAAQGGPESVDDCKQWFWDFWEKQQRWVEEKLSASTADWKMIVTHFPCGHASSWYSKLHIKYGLDLLVTGHRHEQELWSRSALLGGLTCIVTGGGGGITSEVSPVGHLTSNSQYGFFDLAISKDRVGVELINHDGITVKRSTVYSRNGRYSGSYSQRRRRWHRHYNDDEDLNSDDSNEDLGLEYNISRADV